MEIKNPTSGILCESPEPVLPRHEEKKQVLHIVFKETSPLRLLHDNSTSNFTGIAVTKDECDKYNHMTHEMTLKHGIRKWAAVTQATEKH